MHMRMCTCARVEAVRTHPPTCPSARPPTLQPRWPKLNLELPFKLHSRGRSAALLLHISPTRISYIHPVLQPSRPKLNLKLPIELYKLLQGEGQPGVRP